MAKQQQRDCQRDSTTTTTTTTTTKQQQQQQQQNPPEDRVLPKAVLRREPHHARGLAHDRDGVCQAVAVVGAQHCALSGRGHRLRIVHLEQTNRRGPGPGSKRGKSQVQRKYFLCTLKIGGKGWRFVIEREACWRGREGLEQKVGWHVEDDAACLTANCCLEISQPSPKVTRAPSSSVSSA